LICALYLRLRADAEQLIDAELPTKRRCLLLRCVHSKQSGGIGPADFHPVSFADRTAIEPDSYFLCCLERGVNGKQDSIGSDFKQSIQQSLRAKDAARGQVEIFSKVLTWRPPMFAM
jgi:hypothetical protein